MLSLNLKIFLLIISFIYFFIVLGAIKKQKMPIKSSILWIIFGVLIILSVFCQPLLNKICDFIGIEKVSNLLLFCGFMALLILSFDLYKINYQMKKKIVVLGQELAILKNEINRK